MKDFELIKLCASCEFGRANAVAKSTLVALASFYMTGDEYISAPMRQLVNRACVEMHALVKAIDWLKGQGYVSVVKVGRANAYHIHAEKLIVVEYRNKETRNVVESHNNMEKAIVVESYNDYVVESHNNNVVQSHNNSAHTSKKLITKKELVTTNYVNEDLEAPIGEQVANLHANHISAICEQQDYVLNGHEMVGMAKVNGIYLTHSPKLDDIASRGVITVQIFNHCVEKYRSSNAKGPGWLIGTLNNVSLNPKNIIEDIRKAEFAREILEDESLVDNKNKHIWDILNEEPF